ncbi:MAG: YraN family protein [Alphaproteobacteria bacterium]|nr:YraN family protein [Alphaproteobacteria bacterium]
MARDRKAAESKGRVAEMVAIALLTAKGYALIRRRYKSPAGEVDLIMRRGEVTAFIEVKARKTHDEAVISVTDYQARRIANAAAHWMAQDSVANSGTCRFDIVAVNSALLPQHIENAFDGAY